jgi:hypothetical protein
MEIDDGLIEEESEGSQGLKLSLGLQGSLRGFWWGTMMSGWAYGSEAKPGNL